MNDYPVSAPIQFELVSSLRRYGAAHAALMRSFADHLSMNTTDAAALSEILFADVIERRDDVLVCPEAIEDPVQRMARAADLLERLAAAREAPVGASLPDPARTDAG